MVLQRAEGLSDREAVERFPFDARWKYAAGGLDFDDPVFVPMVLVDIRARLARSARPVGSSRRLWTWHGRLGWWAAIGCWTPQRCMTRSPPWTPSPDPRDDPRLAGRRRCRSGRPVARGGHLWGGLHRHGETQIDWDDQAARDALIDSRARDGFAMLTLLERHELDEGVDKGRAPSGHSAGPGPGRGHRRVTGSACCRWSRRSPLARPIGRLAQSCGQGGGIRRVDLGDEARQDPGPVISDRKRLTHEQGGVGVTAEHRFVTLRPAHRGKRRNQPLRCRLTSTVMMVM
jgi:Transposase domain (DUF772)